MLQTARYFKNLSHQALIYVGVYVTYFLELWRFDVSAAP